MATSSTRIDTFNRAADPIGEAEAALASARARLEAMFDNGQKLDPPLTLFPGPELDPTLIQTSDPLRRSGKATNIDPDQAIKDDAARIAATKSFAEELDAPSNADKPAVSMTREELHAKLGEDLRKLDTPKPQLNIPPPPGVVPEVNDQVFGGLRRGITTAQKELNAQTQSPPPTPVQDPLAPEPLEQARSDYEAAAAKVEGPDIEPEQSP